MFDIACYAFGYGFYVSGILYVSISRLQKNGL